MCLQMLNVCDKLKIDGTILLLVKLYEYFQTLLDDRMRIHVKTVHFCVLTGLLWVSESGATMCPVLLLLLAALSSGKS